MKVTLRSTLLTILVSLILITIISQATAFNYFGRRSVNELLLKDLDSIADSIYLRIDRLIDTAQDQSQLNAVMIQNGMLDPAQPSKFVDFLLQMMDASPELSLVGLTLDATGETIGVDRQGGGRLDVHLIRPNPSTKQLERFVYQPQDFPNGSPVAAPNSTNADMRKHVWYTEARQAERQIWTPTYFFTNEHGASDLPGVTCATPVYKDDLSLLGILCVDFDVDELCGYLRTIRVGETGYAFIVELRDDARLPVIAHPDPSLLTGETQGQDGVHRRKLVSADDIADPRIRQFVTQLPAHIDKGNQTHFMPVNFMYEGEPYTGGYQYIKGEYTPDWLICMLLPERDVMQEVWRNQALVTLLGSLILAAAVLASMLVSRQVSQPLEQLARETEEIAHLHVDPGSPIHTIVSEVIDLAVAMEEMKTSLRSFKKYVPEDLVRSLLASNQEAKLGGERRVVTIYFADIVNYTGIAEQLTPEELVNHLREFLTAICAEVTATDGTVDKYIGDAVMAFWGAPRPNSQHALAACTAALRSQARLKELRRRWQETGDPQFFARIGLCSGEVLVGNIGTEDRLNYTVIGDPVNTASRLEGLGKYYGAEIVISDATFNQAKDSIITRPLDWVAVKGKQQGILVHELLGLVGETDSATKEFAQRHRRAMDSYRQRDFAQAILDFEQVLQHHPDDKPAQLLLSRCRTYLVSPPEADWDGVCRMEVK